MPTPNPNHIERSHAVKLVISDGISETMIDSGARLTHSELNRIGFDRLKEDVKKLVESYTAAEKV